MIRYPETITMVNNAKRFDAIVIGGGSCLNIADEIYGLGKKVAIIEEGPLGGTCLNRGCIPSKMFIHVADVMETIANAKKLGIKVGQAKANYSRIAKRVNSLVDSDAWEIEKGIRAEKNFTLYKKRAKFIGKKIVQVGNETITADKIFIGAGTRPLILPIPGIEDTPFLTSTEALRLKKIPKSMVILGGGYIAAELAHFFGSFGTRISIVEMTDRMLGAEDEEISRAFTKAFSGKHKLLLGYKGIKVGKTKQGIFLRAKNVANGKSKTLQAEKLLVAVGRVPNSDLLDVAKSGIATNNHGYIKVDGYMQTNVPGIWAIGDIAGIYLFKHSANLEAQFAFHNAYHPGHEQKVDYTAMPHAVFSSPQVAGVGMTENDAKAKKIDYVAGRYEYRRTAMGAAMMEAGGFVKVIAAKKTGMILGCHIIGPEASTLIHEVVVAMQNNGTVNAIRKAVHAHPALSEVVQRAFNNLPM